MYGFDRFHSRMLLVSILSLTACAAAGAPAQPATTTPSFQAELNWPATSLGAFGGNTGLSGTAAMIATVPFVGTQYADIGLITDQVSFGVAGTTDIAQVRQNPVDWAFSSPIAIATAAPQSLVSFLGPTVLVTATGAGLTSLTATAVGAPVNVSVSAPLYTYRVVDVGCVDAGALGGVAFASDGTYASENTPAASDLYVTGPDCSGIFHDATATLETIHTPYGATLVANSDVIGSAGIFPFFPASLWNPAFTSLTETQFASTYLPACQPMGSPTPTPCPPLNNVLFLKTRLGAIVKMQLAIGQHGTTSGKNLVGAYEVSNASRVFPY